MEETEIVRDIVEKLRSERLGQGISQAELSRRTGLSRSGIRHMENGDVTPTLLFLLRIARDLGVSLADLLREDGKA
ncbi:MAG: helix-turn-helix transcriptional regulator [Verrucomicrobiae bacterium]|nr:helix-turn-helix transcriptional regulator [Verrucomicrobiae bacterium]